MKILFVITFLVYSFQLEAQVEPSVTFDPETGNYIIEYEGYIGEDEEPVLIQRIFEPSTKITPSVNAITNKVIDSSYFEYNYKLNNASNSIQRLYNFYLDVSTSIYEISAPDESWYSGFFSYIPVFHWYNSKGEAGLVHPFDGIAPDSSEDGFSFMSTGLPAIIKAYFSGNNTITLSFPNEPPDEISELLKPLRKFPNNTVIIENIGPKDSPNPFIPLDFLDTLLNYNQRSFELDWITNQTTADKYDSLFNSAKTLLEGNHIPWVENALQTVLEECNEDSSGNITSEAYALLRYNTEYLLENLPEIIAPVLNSISPSLALPFDILTSSTDLTVTASGEFFSDSSVVFFDGEQKTTDFMSDTILTFQLNNSTDIPSVNDYPVWVSNYESNSDTIFFSVVSDLSQPITPTLQCVRNNGGGSYTAYFGYNNINTETVFIAVGQSNHFAPGNPLSGWDRGQPKIFLPGNHTNVFSVNFNGDNLTWTLDGSNVTANKKSAACP